MEEAQYGDSLAFLAGQVEGDFRDVCVLQTWSELLRFLERTVCLNSIVDIQWNRDQDASAECLVK